MKVIYIYKIFNSSLCNDFAFEFNMIYQHNLAYNQIFLVTLYILAYPGDTREFDEILIAQIV